uniref:Uncharacterized protein n=1 Tax=Arundo donax TaxID=35708 RepID=A0A0A9G6B0_ARUDO
MSAILVRVVVPLLQRPRVSSLD